MTGSASYCQRSCFRLSCRVSYSIQTQYYRIQIKTDREFVNTTELIDLMTKNSKYCQYNHPSEAQIQTKQIIGDLTQCLLHFKVIILAIQLALQLIIVWLSMFVELDNDFRFPIPFTQILHSEKQAICKIHQLRIQNERPATSDPHHNQQNPRRKQLLGEMKLSDRQTIIILCYLITSMATVKPKSEQLCKTVFYLCKNEQRNQWVLRAIDKLMVFLSKQLGMCGQKYVIKDIKIYDHSKEFDSKLEKDKSSHKLRRLFVVPFSQYMKLKLQIKEFIYWQNNPDPSIEVKQHMNPFLLKYCKNVDYLFGQTNDLEGILEDLFSITLSQPILNRAWMELTKITKFYNFRSKNQEKSKSIQKPESRDSLKKKTSKQNTIKIVSLINVPQKKETKSSKQSNHIKIQENTIINVEGINENEGSKEPINVDSIKTEHQHLESFRLESEDSKEKEKHQQPEQIKKIEWRVQNFDSKFSQLAKTKQKEIQKKNQGLYARTDRSAPKYLECHYLIQLQNIAHLMNYTVSTFKQKQITETADLQLGSQQHIFSICKKINIPSANFRKFRRLLKTLMTKYPPKIGERMIPTYYLQQVLRFFQKLVIWHQIFSKLPPDEIFSAGSSRFWVFKYKYEFEVQIPSAQSYCKRIKEQLIKLTTFDQKLMLQLLCDGVRSLGCFQNQGYYYDYYEQVFKPSKRLNIGIEYRCPTVVSKLTKSATIGLIINSTPNDEDLHIYSDKPNWSLQQTEIQDKKFDRQNYSQIIRSYGVLVYDLCETVPDGVVVYFPSREIMRECRAQWQYKQNIYERIYQKKRVFQEEEDEKKNKANLNLFRKLCDCGRGAVFFMSAQSDFAKNQTFFGSYSKSIVLLGVPYNPISIEVDNKMRQLKLKDSNKFQAGMRIIARCLSNCINDPGELKVVLFADASFGNFDIRKKWFPFIEEGNLNTSDVIQKVKRIHSKTHVILAQRQNWQEQVHLRKELSFSSFRE